jgi:subtilase family serine protease
MRAGRLVGTGAIVAAMALSGTAGAAVRKPDLTVTKVSLSRKSAAAGGAVTLTATVRNKGARKAPATKLAVYLSRDARQSKSDAKLATKSSRRSSRARPARASSPSSYAAPAPGS